MGSVRFGDHSVVVGQEKVALLGPAAVVEDIKEGFEEQAAALLLLGWEGGGIQLGLRV